MHRSFGPERLFSRQQFFVYSTLAWATTLYAEMTREIVTPVEYNVAPVHVTDCGSGAAVDASNELVASKKKASPLRVDNLNGQSCLLSGEVLLPSPKSRFTILCGASDKSTKDKSTKTKAALELGFDRGGDLLAGRNRDSTLLFKAGAVETKQWLPFLLLRIGRSLRCSVGNKTIECRIVAEDDRGLFLTLRADARVRKVKISPLEVDARRFVPVFMDDLPAISLSGSRSVLGPSAFPEHALPEGLAAVGGVPFCFCRGGLDISTSAKDFKEPFRVSKTYLVDQYTRLQGRTVAGVPADEYSLLHIMAFSRDLPGGVPRTTARIGKFGGAGILQDEVVDVPSMLGGTSSYVRGLVPIKLADGREGFVYHLVVPFARTGNLWEFHRDSDKPLTLEFTRDVRTHVTALDPNEFTEVPTGRPSSVIVLAATLERSPVDVFYTTDEAGNIFNEPQKPLFRVKIASRTADVTAGTITFRCTGPGTAEETADRDNWTVQAVYRVPAGQSAEQMLDLTPPSRRRGWYEAVLEVRDGNTVVQARRTSFALLAPDTRKANQDSPFGVWCFFTSHTLRLESGDQIGEKLLPIIRKAGWRWTYGGAPPGQARGAKGPGTGAVQKDLNRAIQQEYKLTWTLNSPYNAYQRGTGWFDRVEFQEKVVPAVRNALAKGIDCCFKVLHESRSSNMLVARFSEFLGGKPYDMPADEKERIDKQFANVVPYCLALKQIDPKAQVILINDYPPVGIEFMKRSFPKDAFDCFGSEGAMFMREPERQPDWMCLLGILQTWKRAQEKYGYEDKPLWMTEALYHGTNPGNLTLHEQGVRYVRDSLLALANGVQRLAAQGCVNDSTDAYRCSNWGCTGYCFRDPEFNPKPSYAMFAWLTQVLDQATYAGKLGSDSTSLHVLDFVRRDGGHVYPLWVVRGRQKVTLQVEGGVPWVDDPYGNPRPTKLTNGRIIVPVSDAPVYVMGAKVIAVAAHQAIEVPGDAGCALLEFDDPKRIRVLEKPSEVLEGSRDYPRFRGKFSVDHVIEDGSSAVRVELKPDDDQRKLLQRYVELELTEPLLLKGRPYALTARVKGNGGWGRIMFQLVDAKGRIWTSCGNQHPGAANSGDNRGESYVSFDGWHSLTIHMPGQYASPDQEVAWPSNFNWWPCNTPEWIRAQANFPKVLADFDQKTVEAEKTQSEREASGKKVKPKKGLVSKGRPKLLNQGLSPVDYPLRLTKIIVAMSPHILYVDEEVSVRNPVIFINRISELDPPPGF